MVWQVTHLCLDNPRYTHTWTLSILKDSEKAFRRPPTIRGMLDLRALQPRCPGKAACSTLILRGHLLGGNHRKRTRERKIVLPWGTYGLKTRQASLSDQHALIPVEKSV